MILGHFQGAVLNRNTRIALACTAVIVAMVALVGFSLPLYRAFCEATGLGGTTRRVAEGAQPDTGAGQQITIRFNTDVAPGLPWRFGPVQREVQTKLGTHTLVNFWAENESDQAMVAHATYNVTPDLAGRYFNKIQCFCFNEERLGPHQRVQMPVLFYVDPAILQDHDIGNLPAITLSYTFFKSVDPSAAKDLARFGATEVSAHSAATGDPTHGAAVFADRCAPCHALDNNRIGPMLGGLSGRHAGGVVGFDYSPALTHADIVWQAQSLDPWLADPQADVPGSRMPLHLSDAQARADVIAYLLAPTTR